MLYTLSSPCAINELEKAIIGNLARENAIAISENVSQIIQKGLDSITNTDVARDYLTLAASLPCPALTAMQCLAKVPSLGDREVAIIGAGGSVGRILSFLCSHAKVLAVCSKRHHGDLLKCGVSRCMEYDEFLLQGDCELSDEAQESWRLDNKEHLGKAARFYAIFDLQERIDSGFLLRKLGYYGHLVSVVRRVESNPTAAFSLCPSLHEIALGAIYGYGEKGDFAELQRQWEEIISLTLTDSFRAILPPLEVVEFHHIPNTLECLKKGNSGKKFVAWNKMLETT